METLVVLLLILLISPWLFKLLLKISRKYFKPDAEELKIFNEKINFLNNNEELKKTYRNYLFFHYFFGFILMMFFIVAPFIFLDSMPDNSWANGHLFFFIPLVLLNIVSGVGTSMVPVYLLIYLFNRIFQRNISLRYYDVFSLNVNKIFEEKYSDAKKMTDIRWLKFSNFLYTISLITYVITLIMIYVVSHRFTY